MVPSWSQELRVGTEKSALPVSVNSWLSVCKFFSVCEYVKSIRWVVSFSVWVYMHILCIFKSTECDFISALCVFECVFSCCVYTLICECKFKTISIQIYWSVRFVLNMFVCLSVVHVLWYIHTHMRSSVYVFKHVEYKIHLRIFTDCVHPCLSVVWGHILCESVPHPCVHGLLAPGSDSPAHSTYNIFTVEPRFLNKRTHSRSLWAWLALACAAKGTLREETKWSLASTATLAGSGCFCWGGCLG